MIDSPTSNERLEIIKQSPRQANVDDMEWMCEEIERLRPPSAGPVAWRYKDTRGHWRYTGSEPKPEHAILKAGPLYAAPIGSRDETAGCQHEWMEVAGKRGVYRPSFFCPKCHKAIVAKFKVGDLVDCAFCGNLRAGHHADDCPCKTLKQVISPEEPNDAPLGLMYECRDELARLNSPLYERVWKWCRERQQKGPAVEPEAPKRDCVHSIHVDHCPSCQEDLKYLRTPEKASCRKDNL